MYLQAPTRVKSHQRRGPEAYRITSLHLPVERLDRNGQEGH